MAIPNIKLDDRTFQDLVDECKRRIPLYTPQWTSHNLSDPGVTLIELFSYLIEQLLFQANRVPEKNYRSFLDLIGVKLAPPNPARAEINFRLTAPQPNAMNIPKGTEVATVRTDNQEALVFTTERDLVIVPPGLKYVLTTADSKTFSDYSKAVLDRFPPEIPVFQEEPQPGNAFYLGFDQEIASNTLVIGLDCENLGVGIRPTDPPIIWEYWDELHKDWLPLEVARDNSEGLTLPFSEVELNLPLSLGQFEVALNNINQDTILAHWIRCRYITPVRGQPGYNRSPVVKRFSTYTIGGTVTAAHSQVIKMEELGRSSGEASQRFTLRNTPILALKPSEGETILIDKLDDSPPEMWEQVPDFADSGSDDKHFVCDYVSGEISFGPAIRSPNGKEEQHGAIPPFGSRIIVTAYRTGGGTVGNVGSNTITVVKSTVPYIDRITNPGIATGGTNPEGLEQALLRGPRTLRARNRAVTAEDFEVLTREATSGVARVKCLTPGAIDQNGADGERVEPGTVVLLVVPELDPEVRELRPENLQIPPGMRSDIVSYLDERRLLTTNIELTIPQYQWVTVQARVRTVNPYVNDKVKREIERRLYRFIRPLDGGPDPSMKFTEMGEGWPWGRVLYMSEIYPLIQSVEGVQMIERVELYPVIDLARGQAGAPAQMISAGSRGLLCSYRHQIIIV